MPKLTRPTRPLADVNILPQSDGSHEIIAGFMPDPDLIFGEGETRAFLALDASLSLKKMYGFGDPFGGDPNYVQSVARKLGTILAAITRSGSAQALYWAVSHDGSKTEVISDYTEADWLTATITGPQTQKWGRVTKQLPAIQYGYEQIAAGATGTLGVIITDGILEEEKACIDYCLQIGKTLAQQKPEPFKLVLIGIGEEGDAGQLERFDDLFEGTGIHYFETAEKDRLNIFSLSFSNGGLFR